MEVNAQISNYDTQTDSEQIIPLHLLPYNVLFYDHHAHWAGYSHISFGKK